MKTKQEYFKDIRNLIAEAEIDRAIEQLNHFLDNTPQLNEILQQSARWKALRKQVRMGTITREDASVTQNQISSALLELLSLIEEQEGAPAIWEEMERAVISIANSKNVVTGDIRAGGNVHVGDNITVNPEDLIQRIRTCREVYDLDEATKTLFEEWIAQLSRPEGYPLISEIRHQFTLVEADLKNIKKGKNKKLKIWLDRKPQKTDYRQAIEDFLDREEQRPFLFLLAGSSENDGIEDATEMLKQYYFHELWRENEYVREKRTPDALRLMQERDALGAYKIIMRDLLEVNIASRTGEFPGLLAQKYENKHLVVRCKVVRWEEEALCAFFTHWLEKIRREPNYPFVLLLEFSEEDYERLQALVPAHFDGSPLVLLPRLGKVRHTDLDEFYARMADAKYYHEIFDRNSLTSADTPIYYVPAISKLKLKITI